MISKKWKIKFENKMIESLIFRYFNIRNFEISKYLSFYISLFQILTLTLDNWVRRLKIHETLISNSDLAPQNT